MMMRANFHYKLSHVCSALACLLTCLELGIIIKCCQQQQPPSHPSLHSCAINNGNCLDLTPASLANRLALQARARAQARALAKAPACVSHFAWAPMKGTRSPLNALLKLRHVSWFTPETCHLNHSRYLWHLKVESWRVNNFKLLIVCKLWSLNWKYGVFKKLIIQFIWYQCI